MMWMCNKISGVTRPSQQLLVLGRLLYVIIFLIYLFFLKDGKAKVGGRQELGAGEGMCSWW